MWAENCKDILLEGNMGQTSTQKRCYILSVIKKIIVRATVRFQLQHVQMDEMKDWNQRQII